MTRRSGSVSIGVGFVSVLGIGLFLSRSMSEAKAVARIQDPPASAPVSPPPRLPEPEASPPPAVLPPADSSLPPPVSPTDIPIAEIIVEAPGAVPSEDTAQDPVRRPISVDEDFSLPPAEAAPSPLSDPVAAADDLVGRSLKEAEDALKALDKEKAELTERLQKVERGRSRYHAIVTALKESRSPSLVSPDQDPDLMPVDDPGELENPDQDRRAANRSRDPFRAPSLPPQTTIRSRTRDSSPAKRSLTIPDPDELRRVESPSPEKSPEG